MNWQVDSGVDLQSIGHRLRGEYQRDHRFFSMAWNTTVVLFFLSQSCKSSTSCVSSTGKRTDVITSLVIRCDVCILCRLSRSSGDRYLRCLTSLVAERTLLLLLLALRRCRWIRKNGMSRLARLIRPRFALRRARLHRPRVSTTKANSSSRAAIVQSQWRIQDLSEGQAQSQD